MARAKPVEPPRPSIGSTCRDKSSKRVYTVYNIIKHLNSEDIAYIHMKSPAGNKRSIVLFEWYASFDQHTTPSPIDK